jgi:hypothetical protein
MKIRVEKGTLYKNTPALDASFGVTGLASGAVLHRGGSPGLAEEEEVNEEDDPDD